MPNSATDPLTRHDLRARVGRALADWLTETRTALLAVDADLAEVADAIADLVAEGKRLRAGFCYWGWRGAGADDCESIVQAAAGLELLQAAALLHDDLIDASDTRRGLPAAHRRLEGEHRRRGWAGDPERFGATAAILAGDLCLAASAHLLHRATAEMPAAHRDAGLAVYDTMTVQLMAGQYLDVLVGARPHTADAVETARRVIQYKTVNYTVARPLELGGRLAGAGKGVLATYDQYARALGEAFQLRDDLLGVFGDPAQTGKPAGDDLREGKQTVLVAHARDRATPTQAALLGRIGAPDLTDADIADLRTALTDTGAVAEVEARIEQLAAQASASLRASPVSAEADEALTALVAIATRRST